MGRTAVTLLSLAVLAAAALADDGDRLCADCARPLVRVAAGESAAHYVCRTCSTVIHVAADGQETVSRRIDGERRTFPAPEGVVIDFREAVPVLPGPSVRMPGHAVGMPGHAVGLPGHAVEIPAHAVPAPGHPVRLPAHSVTLPAHAVQQPGHPVGLPAHSVRMPGQAVVLPGHPVGLPGHSVGRPGFAMAAPGAVVRRVELTVDTPSDGGGCYGLHRDPTPIHRAAPVQRAFKPRTFAPPARS